VLNVTINVFEFSLILGYHKTSSAQLSQHVAISNSGSRAVECNPGQVVHTYRYQLTVMLGGWGLTAGLVKSVVAFWYIWIQKFPEDAIFAKNAFSFRNSKLSRKFNRQEINRNVAVHYYKFAKSESFGLNRNKILVCKRLIFVTGASQVVH